MSRITGLTESERQTLESLSSWLELRIQIPRRGLLSEFFDALQDILAGAETFKLGDPVCLTPLYPGRLIDSKLTGWSIAVLPTPPFYALKHTDGSVLAVMEGEFEPDVRLE